MSGTFDRAAMTLAERVRAAVGDLPLSPPAFPGEVRVETPPARLVATCSALATALGAPLATMVGRDDRANSGSFRLNYIFGPPGGWVTVATAIDPANPRFDSVTPALPAAHWYEREVHDLLGLTPAGHPDPRPLVLHDNWPPGLYPLRKEFDPAQADLAAPHREYRAPHLRGEGLVEIPVGPIHAGVIEPAHFRIAAIGEVVLNIDARLFYTHRGLEKLAEGKTAAAALQIAERISGISALSHAVSYCQAIETLAGAPPPPRAIALRTLGLELERLYNHIGDLGNLCAGAGFAIGTSIGAGLKEEFQQLNERLFGHRFLRGFCQIGGVRRDLDRAAVTGARATVRRLYPEYQRFAELFASTESFTERMERTGIVSTAAARDLGAVGVTARASGLAVDARHDHPYAGYPDLRVPLAVKMTGDVRARADVRIDEAFVSFRLVEELLAALPAGPLAVGAPSIPPNRTALGVTESPQGENIHWVRTDANGRIDRYRIRAAAYCNWPMVALAVPGNMVPDFPLINKSFELSYACCDR